jgi:putative membrane protein
MKRLLSLAGVTLAVAGCDNSQLPSNTVATPVVQPLNDAQSVAVLRSLDLAEIRAAQIVLPRTGDTQVQNFARQMINDHTQADEQLAQLGILGVPGAVSQAVDSDSQRLAAQLTQTPLDQLDLTYMNSQVAAHEEALVLMDCAIVPGASAALSTLVQNTLRPMMQAHLNEAASIAGGLPLPLSTGSTTSPIVTIVSVLPVSCDAACSTQTPGGLSGSLLNAACVLP